MAHCHRVASSLVRQEATRIAGVDGGTATLSGTSAASPSAASACAAKVLAGPQALLDISPLGVTAPIEEGSTDAVLAGAVGHDRYSVSPDTNGTSVLLSHDVTYFVNINHLKSSQLATT
jgi:hypothetical protein